MDGSAFRGLGDAIVMGFYVLVASFISAILLASILIWQWFSAPDWQAEAIERGYALHCPKDGRFAWKGECDE